MRIFTQVLLVIIFLITYLISFFAGSVRYGFLNSNFLINTFRVNRTYDGLSAAIKSSIENIVVQEGGKTRDVDIIIDLFTPENTADFVNNNLVNITDYLNGNSGELIIYLPLNRVPGDLLPTVFTGINNEMTLTQVAERFRIEGLADLPLQNLSMVGEWIFYIFAGSLALLIIWTILLFLTTPKGKRYIALGVSFFVSGLATVMIILASNSLSESFGARYLDSTNISQVLVGVTIPVILTSITLYWGYLAMAFVTIGAVLILMKRSGEE